MIRKRGDDDARAKQYNAMNAMIRQSDDAMVRYRWHEGAIATALNKIFTVTTKDKDLIKYGSAKKKKDIDLN